MNTDNNSNNNYIILSVFRNKILVQLIGKYINYINTLYYTISHRFNRIPSLKWVVENDTGSLLHDLCKRSSSGVLPLSTLQVGWATLDMIITICSPHQYHRSVTFKIESFDVIYQYYESAFKGEHYALDCAADSGNIQLVNYLISKSVPFTTNAIDRAARHGYLDIIKLLIDYNPPTQSTPLKGDDIIIKFTNHSYDMAATNGHINVLLYFDQLNDKKKSSSQYQPVEFTVRAIDGAAKNNHFVIVDHILTKYGNDKRMKGYLFTEEALQWSISHNNLDAFTKLLNYPHPDKKNILKNDKWMIDALIHATSKGYIDIIKWVYNQKLISYIPEDLIVASSQHNQPALLSLYFDLYSTNKSLIPPTGERVYRAIYASVRHNNFQMFKLLLEMFRKEIDEDKYGPHGPQHQSYRTLIEACCRHNNLEFLKWIVQSLSTTIQTSSTDWKGYAARVACINGRLDIVKYFVNEQNLVLCEELLEDCVASGSIDCVEFVLDQRVKLTVQAVTLSCKKGFDKIMKLLFTKTSIPNIVEIRDNNIQDYFNAAINSESLGCLLAIGKGAYLASLSHLFYSVEKGNTPIVKYLIQEYPYLLDPVDGESTITEALLSQIQNNNYEMVEFILSLKCHHRRNTSEKLNHLSGKESLLWVPTDTDRFTIDYSLLQWAAQLGDSSMIQLILEKRPNLAMINPNSLLAFGLIDLFDIVTKRNNELNINEENELTINSEKVSHHWFYRAIELGNIDLIRYLVHQIKKVKLPSPSLLWTLASRILSVQAINYMKSNEYKPYSSRPSGGSNIQTYLLCSRSTTTPSTSKSTSIITSQFSYHSVYSASLHYLGPYAIKILMVTSCNESSITTINMLAKRDRKKFKQYELHQKFNYNVLQALKKSKSLK